MERYLKSSLIFRTLIFLLEYYKRSFTHKVFLGLIRYFKSSVIYSLVIRFLKRDSSLKYSRTKRVFSKIFLLFDRLWDRLYHFGENCTKSSFSISFIKKTFCGTRSFEAYALVVLFFSIGFAAASFFLGTLGTVQAILAGTGIFIALLLLIGRAKWEKCLGSSLFWRLTTYFFD